MANDSLLPAIYQAPGQPARPEKILMYAMGAGVVLGAGFLVREYLISRKDAAFNYPTNTQKKSVNLLPKKKSENPPNSQPTSTDQYVPGFPLKKGSTGMKVMQLQQGLAKILGDEKLSKYGSIDGKFGPGTENALKAAGYPTVVDAVTFQKITGTNPKGGKSIAQEIYDAAQSSNLSATLAALKKIGNVQEYTVADEQYKTLTKSKGLVRKTIVNDLLSYAFDSNESAKDQIKDEFLRIGLKLDASSGTWSLSGLNPPGTIMTLVPTFIVDAGGRALLIGRNVILGKMIQVKNGYTWFKSIDNTVAAAPSSDIKYL
jgi:peptidoglycan hydrolase-like protein with peptidoglycan-binding domain